MKKILVVLCAMGFFMGACADKKAEEQQKAIELEEQIEAVDQETNEDLEALEKESEELDKSINELDSL